MTNTWLVLLPPMLVLIAAFITKKLNPSLFIGIIVAALIATNINVLESISLVKNTFTTILTDLDNIYMYLFLIILGIVIVLINKIGGAAAFARVISKKLGTSRAAQTSTIMLSFFVCIDDYLSILTTGYVMRPITDQFKIPRAKLAFLIHALAGPLIVLIPISSWDAMIINQLDSAGIDPVAKPFVRVLADPFWVYLKSIPYIFYSIFIIASAWYIVHRLISYGPMRQYEAIADKTGNLLGGKQEPRNTIDISQQTNGTIFDLIVPIGTLLITVFIGIPYTGGFDPFHGNVTLLDAFKNNRYIFLVLCCSSAITLFVSFFLALVRKKIKFNQIPDISIDGTKLMLQAIIMLILASTLGIILRVDLQTGQYLSQLISGVISTALLPPVLFLLSLFIATITGTAWGTIALMVPITVQMVIAFVGVPTPTTLETIPLLFPVLGAILSGAACGDQISPISETTIMAGVSTSSSPIDHTYTQIPYAIPAIVSATLSFFLAGLLINYPWWISLLVPMSTGLIICFSLLSLLNKRI